MDGNLKRQDRSLNWLRILLGILFFLIGGLVYWIDRPAEHTYFFTEFNSITTFHDSLPTLFGTLGNYLPDFIHPVSFILITAGILRCEKTECRIICFLWLAINLIFEFGQKYSDLFLKAIPDWFSGIPFLEAFESYFVHGVFDPNDIIAIVAGTGVAYLILLLTMKRREV